jgi:hypothetical protein
VSVKLWERLSSRDLHYRGNGESRLESRSHKSISASHAPTDGQKVFQPSRTGFFYFNQNSLKYHGRRQRVTKGRVPFLNFDTEVPGHRIQVLIKPEPFCIGS